ncbi:hypothetical protein [Lactococcus garvieae]|uniref:hypothetical protein n=1 Tax=Lactococcus garvieae TaxID=1363 RepID=UPI00385270CF
MTIENQDLVENNSQILFDTQNIIKTMQNNSILSVGFERVQMYWKIGEQLLLRNKIIKSVLNMGNLYKKI